MTNHDLLRKLDDHPFKAFRMKMVNSTVFDVLDPGMLIVGDNSAVIATQNIRDDRGNRVATEWKTVSIQHILEFSDIEPSRNGGKKKGK